MLEMMRENIYFTYQSSDSNTFSGRSELCSRSLDPSILARHNNTNNYTTKIVGCHVFCEKREPSTTLEKKTLFPEAFYKEGTIPLQVAV